MIITDIDATVSNTEPDYSLIEKIANQSRMPLCYSGGIKKLDQAKNIFSLGIEKIAISSAAIENPNLIKDIAESVGNQSVVVVLDVKKKFLGLGYDIFTHNGKKKTGIELTDFIDKIKKMGVGEILLNSIDQDGTMLGYDYNLVEKVKKLTTLPLTVLGGAGSLDDISNLIKRYKIIGAGAGSLFVFKGKYKAVLINYPNQLEKIALINKSMK